MAIGEAQPVVADAEIAGLPPEGLAQLQALKEKATAQDRGQAG